MVNDISGAKYKDVAPHVADDRRWAGGLPRRLHPAAVRDAPAQREADQDDRREDQARHSGRRRQERQRRAP